MQGTQLTIWDAFERTEETRLDKLVNWSFAVFDALNPNLDYQLAFSGGKDSHVLLGIYLIWKKSRQRNLNLKVVFSDTFLESTQLYELVELVENKCKEINVPFVRVQPALKQGFWFTLVALGYPVPDYKNRWCTTRLKIRPCEKQTGIILTGSHMGESANRNRRLQSCGSSECGVDMIAKKIEPLTPWTNCDVWDWIVLSADNELYSGVSAKLLALYDVAENDKGSLRMGCFMCPVVVKSKIEKQVKDGIIPEFAIQIRELIEKLRQAPRIMSPKSKKAGAILIDARIEFWQNLQQYIPRLKEYGWIKNEEIQLIDEMLKRRTYPPTYKAEWIAEQEPLAESWYPKTKARKASA